MMQISFYDVVYLFSELFTLYSIKLFYDIFFQIRKGCKGWVIGSYTLYFLGVALLHFFVSIPFVNLISNIFMLSCIALCYESTFRKKIVAVFEIYLIMFAVELFVSALTQSAYIQPFQKYEYENELGLFLSRMGIFLIILLISHLVDLKNKKDLPMWLCLASLTVPILTVSIEMIFITTSGTTKRLVVTSMILLFAVNIVVFFLYNSLSTAYERSMKATAGEREREYYQNQCLLMQEAAEDVRAFRHDIVNHLNVIENLLQSGKTKEASEYILELAHSEKTISAIYANTGNIAIDSIVNYKLCNAVLHDIAVSAELLVPTELSMEIIDLSTILTNLLDNALQALQQLSENKKLFIKIIYRKGVLLIRIQNTYNGTTKYANGRLITTKENTRAHGYGMRNIENVVQKYDGACRFHHDAMVFQAEVLLYMK